MIIQQNKSLKNFNSFGVQCFAENFINIKKDDDIKEIISYLKKTKCNHFILGGGSNILFTKNIKGAVLYNQIEGINIIKEDSQKVTIRVGAGVIWNDFVNWSINNNLWGIENLILIPGTVGAAPIQNIGAYGSELKDVIKNVTGFNIKTGEKIILNKSQCEFEYRNSIFKKKLKNIFFISEIQVILNKNGSPNLNYEILKNELKKEKKPISLKKIALTVSRIRKSKLPDPKKIGNAGSFFKNPIISRNRLNQIKREFPEIKYYDLNKKIIKSIKNI